MEEWRDIKGLDGEYQISNLGRVKSLKRKYVPKEKIIKAPLDNSGYNRIRVKNRTIKVHRAVAQAFIPNPNNKKNVNHINGIKNDNRVENLEWCTKSENLIHAYKNGLMKQNYQVKLTNKKTKKITHMYSCSKASEFLGRYSGYIKNQKRKNIFENEHWKWELEKGDC